MFPNKYPASFSWYWEFEPVGVVRSFVKHDDPEAYVFTAEFPVAGDNSVSLRVEFE